MIRPFGLLIAAAVSVVGQDLSNLGMSFQSASGSAEDIAYENARRALDAAQWERAIAELNAAAKSGSAQADRALYWTAYAESRVGEIQEALSTLAKLEQNYTGSRWIEDAKALEFEIRDQAGAPVNPAATPDEDLKIYAINGLMQSDPAKALPILEKLLSGNASPRVKERALFVLTQSRLPEARKKLDEISQGSAGPELQKKAIRYLGMTGSDEDRKRLAAMYGSLSDRSMKDSILESLMISRSRDALASIARNEKDPDLRRKAVRQLALVGGSDELWGLYQSEQSPEVKKDILNSMFLTRNSAHLADIARNEKDPVLRIAAIRSLALVHADKQSDVLVDIYRSDQNRQVREAVLNALFLQHNGRALVDLARTEKDPEMRKQIVSKMALVHSKETSDYMMEILK